MFDKGSIRVEVTNTYPYTLVWLKGLFGGTVSVKRNSYDNKRTTYRYTSSGSTAFKLCNLILPFVKEKHKQVLLVVQLADTKANSELRKTLGLELSKLKNIDYV